MLADELFGKALRNFETCALVNNNLCRKLFSSLDERFDERFKVTWLPFFIPDFKVGLSPSKLIWVICFIDSPLKMMKNSFHFILKSSFHLEIFKFLSWLSGHAGKTTWLER